MKLNNKIFIISISGGNILTSLGGTEKVIISHQKMFNAHNISYVYIYPVYKVIANIPLYFYWGVVVDGKMEGVFSTKELLASICSKDNIDNSLLKIHIHHLRGINLNELSEILDHFGNSGIFFYLHDFYLLCDEYTLKNSSGEYCGIGIPSKEKCKMCKFYRFKENSKNRRMLVFKYLDRITLIAPSECPADIISNSIPVLKNKIEVVCHQKRLGNYKNNKKIIENEEIKVAFCGLPIDIKGWDEFVYSSEKAIKNGVNLRFYHLGKKSSDHKHIINYQVGFQKGCKTMTETLRDLEIDCVVLWSKRPETYSYVYFECFAANVFVITNVNSGNIAKQVTLNGNGIVLNSREDLSELLLNAKKLKTIINEFKTAGIEGPLELSENNKIVNLSLNKGTLIENYNFRRIRIKRWAVEKMYLRHLEKKCKYHL